MKYSSKERRTSMRVPLIAENATVRTSADSLSVEMGDISNNGVFVKTEASMSPQTPVMLDLVLPGDLGILTINGRAVRVVWTVNKKQGKSDKGFGIQFDNPSPSVQKILDAYIIYLRNKQIINVSKRIIEEFFGSQGPNKEY